MHQIFLLLFFSPLLGQAVIDFSLYFESGNKIVKGNKRIQLVDYPNAYNPSIIRIDDGFLLTFRYNPDYYAISYIGIVLLDNQFNPIEKPQLLQTREKSSDVPSQAEDGRIFSYRNHLFLIYNDSIDELYSYGFSRRDMFLAELKRKEEGFILSPPLRLVHLQKYPYHLCQKNWVPFEWEENLLFSYSVNPHEILHPNLNRGDCYPYYETTLGSFSWPFGPLRGGTPALRVADDYLSFFHSSLYTRSSISPDFDCWHYFMGACTFSSSPPFSIKTISHKPLVVESFYQPSSMPKKVIFPGGFVFNEDSIYLAYGKDDCEMWIATLDLKELLLSLTPP